MGIQPMGALDVPGWGRVQHQVTSRFRATKRPVPPWRRTSGRSELSNSPVTRTSTHQSSPANTRTMAPPNSKPVAARAWSHTPSTPLLLWLAISLPLVTWDTGYMLLRPHSMPGGSLHSPLWVPYALYGEVDGMYGFKQWDLKNPFAAAQSLMNVVETVMYLVYLWLWSSYGKPVVSGNRKAIGGKIGGLTVLLGFSAAVMTVSKTVLYCELLPLVLSLKAELTVGR